MRAASADRCSEDADCPVSRRETPSQGHQSEASSSQVAARTGVPAGRPVSRADSGLGPPPL